MFLKSSTKKEIAMHFPQIATAFAAASLAAAAHAAPLASDDFDANTLKLNGVPAGWSVTGGTVDIIGSNFSGTAFNLVPGHGAYIDLDGSSADAGLLSRSFMLTAGVEYTASFDLAGSHRGSTESGTVTFGAASLTYQIASATDFAGYVLTFTPETTGDYALTFQNAGGDNVGALLDNVAVTFTSAVPEPGAWALTLAGLLVVGLRSRRSR
jgi:hypothetical protein